MCLIRTSGDLLSRIGKAAKLRGMLLFGTALLLGDLHSENKHGTACRTSNYAYSREKLSFHMESSMLW
jgi:hypothetical protein